MLADNLLCDWLTAVLHTDGILPCKGYDKYLKLQEIYVKNVFFLFEMKKTGRGESCMKKMYYICEVIHYLMYGLRNLKLKCENRKLKTEVEA